MVAFYYARTQSPKDVMNVLCELNYELWRTITPQDEESKKLTLTSTLRAIFIDAYSETIERLNSMLTNSSSVGGQCAQRVSCAFL